VKFINKALLIFFLISCGLSKADGKSIEFLLDHETKKTFHLDVSIPEQMQEHPFTPPSFLSYCQQLKVENVGDVPIEHCFPYINQAPPLFLEALASQLAEERYPLLALYQRWNHSVMRDDSFPDRTIHPLDLLNFTGVCSSTTFYREFIKLCHALGIETRLANIQGGTFYDFGLDEEWNFLDLINNHLYMHLDNETLASSEDVMDDPFLALRTKHIRQAKEIDFKEAWKQVAHFDVLAPTFSPPLVSVVEKLSQRAKGMTLFPGETLLFETTDLRPELAPYECWMTHVIDLETRGIPKQWTYLSCFPIHQITNNSHTPIDFPTQAVELKPGDSLILHEDNLFQIQMAFSEIPKGTCMISGKCSWSLFPSLRQGDHSIHLGAEKNPTVIRFRYEVNEKLEKKAFSSPRVLNQEKVFDHCSPYFMIEPNSNRVKEIWWQIGFDEHFQLIPPNFDQVEPFRSVIPLPPISETFLSPETSYYFRIKEFSNGQWSEWSASYPFAVQKPAAVQRVEFEAVDENVYELNWERDAEASERWVEYLVFGSNSLDFIPSIYCQYQVNGIVDGKVTEEEWNDNLVAVTPEPHLQVDGSFAYYRIIARERGQLSVPSPLIHIYDQELVQPRNVLQIAKDDHRLAGKRMLFPATSPLLPLLSQATIDQTTTTIDSLIRSLKKLTRAQHRYELPDVAEEVWQEVRPYLLPENHPARPKLNRIFCNSRATQSPEHFKKAGFRRWRPGRLSRVAASSHPECKESFIKAYCDTELGILYDWKKWIHRIKGAETVRTCIKEYDLAEHFKVPHKWIYPLPKYPAPPTSSSYLRKNFVLICENMRIQEHKENEKMYRKKMTHQLMEGLYTILQVCGLYDSVYVFNIPFCKDGRIAIIDTEYHHKWPVPFEKLNKAFSKDLQSYWHKITFRGGKIPNGVSQPNPPRMDRRDIPD